MVYLLLSGSEAEGILNFIRTGEKASIHCADVSSIVHKLQKGILENKSQWTYKESQDSSIEHIIRDSVVGW